MEAASSHAFEIRGIPRYWCINTRSLYISEDWVLHVSMSAVCLLAVGSFHGLCCDTTAALPASDVISNLESSAGLLSYLYIHGSKHCPIAL